MPTARIQTTVSGDTDTNYSKSFQVSGGGRIAINELVPEGSVDLEVAFELDVSQAKSFMLRSNEDLTIETNSGTAAENTFNLAAGVPFIWPSSEGQSFLDTQGNPVNADITALFVTNASENPTNLWVDCIYDPTV